MPHFAPVAAGAAPSGDGFVELFCAKQLRQLRSKSPKTCETRTGAPGEANQVKQTQVSGEPLKPHWQSPLGSSATKCHLALSKKSPDCAKQTECLNGNDVEDSFSAKTCWDWRIDGSPHRHMLHTYIPTAPTGHLALSRGTHQEGLRNDFLRFCGAQGLQEQGKRCFAHIYIYSI